VNGKSTRGVGFFRRAEQERHSCKSTTRARLSGATSSKEQGFGDSEQASCLIIQGVNRRFTGRASRARASRAASLRSHARFIFSFSALRLRSVWKTSAKTQNARAASRRAQFQLWIFSYTNLVGSSKKRVSRLMIGPVGNHRLATDEIEVLGSGAFGARYAPHSGAKADMGDVRVAPRMDSCAATKTST
jgi:hypothetical protein